MADAAAIIGAVCAGAATIITAWSTYKSARSADRLREEQEKLAEQQEALKRDHERAARDTGQRLYGLVDKVNTLDARATAVQRTVERIPTTSQWAFRMGQTPPTRVVEAAPPLKGPSPPLITPLWDPEKEE
jgi:uncharacterized protein HemX